MDISSIVRKVFSWVFGKAVDKGIEKKMEKAQADAMKQYGAQPGLVTEKKDTDS
jgi:hypothetical protein